MPYLHAKYYYADEEMPEDERIFRNGYQILEQHSLFQGLQGDVHMKGRYCNGKGAYACVDKKGNIFVNVSHRATAQEWAYIVAHCLLHLAFGHFDADKMPENCNYAVWNKTCDIYIARFLADIHFGEPVVNDPAEKYRIKLNDERKIYEHLLYSCDNGTLQDYGVNSKDSKDMVGLEHPVIYKSGAVNEFTAVFVRHLAHSTSNAVSRAGGHKNEAGKETVMQKAAQWFLSHYPLLGGVAASFRIIDDYLYCQKNEIRIAAVNPVAGKIYVNAAAGLSEEEWKFVLAHEYLHAGLSHHTRCQGRDRYLWNIACDYVINGWLQEMRIGEMPEDVLYDEELHGLSAESIYDLIVKQFRRFRKHATMRGYGKGDVISGGVPYFSEASKGIKLDDYIRNALREGLDFHDQSVRGYLPAGLVEEIKALASPPIPWDVELGRWFDSNFPPMEKHHSYARASRRQSSTPDIARPGYSVRDEDLMARTLGVVIDTSGSVSDKQIGLSLGAVASYAVSRDIRMVRVVFCDAEAYDAGYMEPEQIAGKVEITGRGGTVLQPAVTLLEKAKDFPTDGPILIITDGYIEDRLYVHRNHAYLLPKGNKLLFTPKGKVFYFD